MYERVIDRAMKEATVRKFGNVNVMAATHNEDTVRFCVQRYACAVLQSTLRSKICIITMLTIFTS